MSWRGAFLIGLASASFSWSAIAQPAVVRLDGRTIAVSEIDVLATSLMKAGEVPGMGIAVLNRGRAVHVKAYGYRSREQNLPLTADSTLGTASLTKAAFAYLVMQLVDDGTLDLDRPVHQYLPKPLTAYPAYQDLAGDPRSEQITPRMLLSHTSGFPNFRQSNQDLRLNIHFKPGSRYAYSGEGMQLLQLVVETVAQRSLTELMRARVFEPLGMNRTSMVSDLRMNADAASGSDEWGRSLGVQTFARPDAAGSMQSTLNDMTRFAEAVLAGKGLTKTSRTQMLTPQIDITSKRQFPTLDSSVTDENRSIKLSYGLGWGLYFTPYGKAFFKEGHAAGFQHYMVMFEDVGAGLIIMTNSSNGEGIFKALLETVLGNPYTPIVWEGFTPYDERPARKPLPAHQEITLDPAILDRYVGQYGVQGAVLTVTREGTRLFIQENDQAKVEIFAEKERQFFSKAADDVFTFEGDDKGRAATMVVHSGGRSVPLKRLK